MGWHPRSDDQLVTLIFWLVCSVWTIWRSPSMTVMQSWRRPTFTGFWLRELVMFMTDTTALMKLTAIAS